VDPEANLQEQLELSKKMLSDYREETGNGIDQDDAARLAELVTELNDWIKKGGFLPKSWNKENKK
jgi:hypothetical protein